MITIRSAQPEDAEHIVAFNMAMALETEQKELDHDTLTRGVQAVFDNPAHGFYIVAEADSQPIGSLLVTSEWSDWRYGLFWWIQSVYVLPQWRRKECFALYIHLSLRRPQRTTMSEVCDFMLKAIIPSPVPVMRHRACIKASTPCMNSRRNKPFRLSKPCANSSKHRPILHGRTVQCFTGSTFSYGLKAIGLLQLFLCGH